MTTSSPLERVLSGLLTAAALVIAAVLVYRELYPTGSAASKPRRVKEWQQLASMGTRIGSEAAPLQLLEFTDIECPFCASFHSRFVALDSSYPGAISLVVLHYPIESHVNAAAAAIAAECAGAQGRFKPFLTTAFAMQDSLGHLAWTQLARSAGVPDTTQFASCLGSTAPPARIAQHKAEADRVSIRGTPTIIVNGWLYPSPPHDSILLRAMSTGSRFKP